MFYRLGKKIRITLEEGGNHPSPPPPPLERPRVKTSVQLMTELQKEKKKAPCLLNEIQTQIQNVHIVKRQWLRALLPNI